jgi:DNA-binding NarL/FixJ family response regulator
LLRLLVVDDETLVREALVSLLALHPNFEIAAEAINGKQAVELSAALKPDLVVMDIQMPVMNGINATVKIKAQNPEIKILMLTTFDDDQLVIQVMSSGANGYILKDCGAQQIAAAIESVHNGYTVLGATVAPKIISNLAEPFSDHAELHQEHGLTNKELEVLQLLSQGVRTQQIAESLGITEKTVRDHVAKILSRLNLRDRTQAALWAQRNLH